MDNEFRSGPSPPFWYRHLRREVQFLLDLGVLAAAFALAYLLRFDFRIPPRHLANGLVQLPVVVLLQFATLLATGVYRFVWRYIGLVEARAFLRAATFSSVPLLLMRLGLPDVHQQWRVPLSVLLMDAMFACAGLVMIRVARRLLYERYERARRRREEGGGSRERALLLGAGWAGVSMARELQGGHGPDIEAVGFVDDDPTKRDAVIHGIKVLGGTADLPALVRLLDVDQVIICIARADAQTMQRLIRLCQESGVKVRIIPGIEELRRGGASVVGVRELAVEDLLGREPVRLDERALRRFLHRKAVMVTGAGGSIGAELCRQIARFGPAALVAVERSEGALFEMRRILERLWPELALVPVVADIGDADRVRQILERHRPRVVLHAAAHKHVPLMEENPGEAVRNNVLATARLAALAGEAGVDACVLISTDKAVRPASVMGASKRLAELVFQEMDRRFPRTRFASVRFGNVIGSAGSVVPIFRQQIEDGGPVTVTDPNATRYFLTIEEAAQLVLQAAAQGGGGQILLLDMGRPLKIVDLARQMIHLVGRRPFDEIPILFTGLRAGEKLTEELGLTAEVMRPTGHPKILAARVSPPPPGWVDAALERLAAVASSGDGEIRAVLEELLPEARLLPSAASGDGLQPAKPRGRRPPVRMPAARAD